MQYQLNRNAITDNVVCSAVAVLLCKKVRYRNKNAITDMEFMKQCTLKQYYEKMSYRVFFLLDRPKNDEVPDP